ncbi:Slx4 domain containing protein [Trichuris trichiura]|uniref:Structure-specific endonuclease subunit SLX4 n=1 Tax=Trichuris trichiura TaxID=36087 RepID=A0A077ZHM4_TRITR|nr:Slx4 domain containing protein [Trichuris trichiura]
MSKKTVSLAEDILFSGSYRLEESSDFFESPPAPSASSTMAISAETCPACAKGLDHYTVIQRRQHINNCLDSEANRKSLLRKRELWMQTTDCPLCCKPLNSGPFRQAHLKQCGKAHKVPPSELLRLMQIQEKIAETRKQSGLSHTKLKKPTISSVRNETASREKDVPKTVFDEQVHLAQALSRSLLEKELPEMVLPTSSKCLKQTLLQTKLEMSSPKTRLGILEARLSDLLVHCLSSYETQEKISKPKYLWPSFESDGPVYTPPVMADENHAEEVASEKAEEPKNKLIALQKQRIELLLSDMSSLLGSDTDMDVEMFCGPGFERCNAHSLILKSRCPSLLKCASKQPSGRYDLFLPEITVDCMRIFLRYLYFADDEFFNSLPHDTVVEVLQRFPPSGWNCEVTGSQTEQQSHGVSCIPAERDNTDDAASENHNFVNSLLNREYDVGCALEDDMVIDLTADEPAYSDGIRSSLNVEAYGNSTNEIDSVRVGVGVENAFSKASEVQDYNTSPKAESLQNSATTASTEQPRRKDWSAQSFFGVETLSLDNSAGDIFDQGSFKATDNSIICSSVEYCHQLSPEIAMQTCKGESRTGSPLPKIGTEVCKKSTVQVDAVSVAKTNFSSPLARMSRKLVKNAILRTPVMQKLNQQGVMVIKTKNVTPALDLTQVATPELHVKLRRYGVRALPKRKAVAVLERIYNETHPYVHENGSIEVPAVKPPVIRRKRRAKEDLSNKETSPEKCNKPDVIEECSLHELSEERISLEESFIPCAPTLNSPKKKVSRASRFWFVIFLQDSVSDDDTLRQLLISNADIYEDILTYKPLNLKNVHRRLRQGGARCSLKNLLNYLDAQCITFSMKKFDEEQ